MTFMSMPESLKKIGPSLEGLTLKQKQTKYILNFQSSKNMVKLTSELKLLKHA